MKTVCATARVTILAALFLSVVTAGERPQPPKAAVKPTILEKHGHKRTDNYYWLRERENPDVVGYLNAENAYTDSLLAPVKGFEEALFNEMKGRIKQTDLSVPFKENHYYYYVRYDEGKEYPIYCRKKESLEASEEVLIDGNARGSGLGYYQIGSTAVSTGENLLAFTEDTVGRRIYTIRVKDVASGTMLADEIAASTPNIAWANDNMTLFYAKQDPVTLRYYRIYRHRLGTESAKDQVVYEETDETFSCSVFRTKSKRFMMIASNQTLSSEYRVLSADTPTGDFTVFLPRAKDHEYSVDHFRENFYIRTNNKAKNFRLMKTPLGDTRMSAWKEVLPHRKDVLLEDFDIFRDHLVVTERKLGLIQLRIIPWKGGAGHYVVFDEPTYAAAVGTNPDFNTSTVRFTYQSLVTPNSVYDYDMNKRSRTLQKRDEVLGGYDPSQYQSERRYAKARDGAMIPISLVYKKGLIRDGSHPLLLYGYGSYGFSTDATFGSQRLSLLDRGCTYAIAHIRGGEELGRSWYEDGKLLKKKNTFTDFIDCGEFLVREHYTASDRMFAMGGSAGGLLMGAVVNIAPQLFKGVVAAVPFVDVVTTMLDETIPLTTSEYDEWGNPNEQRYYDYMLSYSPYDNVEAKAYPNLLVLTGLHDSQVQYWEPAKWVAKLRAMKTDPNVLILKTNMEAGHGGASGRFRRLRDVALQYTFILWQAGVVK